MRHLPSKHQGITKIQSIVSCYFSRLRLFHLNFNYFFCFFFFRYRLVRHTWNLNVNESLSLDATCTLNNASSHDLGIDLYVKNQNQVHHALVTEIFLSDLTLFCPTYKFIPDSIKCKFGIIDHT